MKYRSALLAAVAPLAAGLLPGAAGAHHSTAVFLWGQERTIDVTIDKWQWTQPHSFVWGEDPKAKGDRKTWGFEGMSPSWLGRRGWNIKSIKPGDKVKVVYYPLRDGRPGGFFVRVIYPDGRTLEAFPKAMP